MKFAPEDSNANKSVLDYVMAWHLFGAKPLTEPMLTYFSDT